MIRLLIVDLSRSSNQRPSVRNSENAETSRGNLSLLRLRKNSVFGFAARSVQFGGAKSGKQPGCQLSAPPSSRLGRMCVRLIYAILFRTELLSMTRLGIRTALFLVFLLTISRSYAQDPVAVEEFRDAEYAYGFRYPADWKLQKLPEGEANKDMRVALRGTKGSSFTVVVARGGNTFSRAAFEANPKRSELVDNLMRQSIEQIYRAITKNLGAAEMKLGERQDLSNSTGVKFYVSTLNIMKAGKPIIVAGIHAFPFAKSYSVNFMMTAFLERGAKKENALLRAVFNSFHLFGEPAKPRTGFKPASGSPEKSESN